MRGVHYSELAKLAEGLFLRCDIDILRELTERDDEKPGVPLEHRKRLLKTITNLEATGRSAAASILHPRSIESHLNRA
jgi:hypothetical protein